MEHNCLAPKLRIFIANGSEYRYNSTRVAEIAIICENIVKSLRFCGKMCELSSLYLKERKYRDAFIIVIKWN